MTAGRRTVPIFSSLWLALALAQCIRSAGICDDGSATARVLWALQFAMLGVPLIVIYRGRMVRGLAGDDSSSVSVVLVLLAYVPVTLALRLGEMCVAHR